MVVVVVIGWLVVVVEHLGCSCGCGCGCSCGCGCGNGGSCSWLVVWLVAVMVVVVVVIGWLVVVVDGGKFLFMVVSCGSGCGGGSYGVVVGCDRIDLFRAVQ